MHLTPDVKVISSKDIPPKVISEGVEVRRLVTSRREHSDRLQLGLATFRPGSRESMRSEVDEALYVIRGRLRLSWGEGRQTTVEEGQAAFLPSGFTYEETNPTDGNTVVIYALSPPIE